MKKNKILKPIKRTTQTRIIKSIHTLMKKRTTKIEVTLTTNGWQGFKINRGL
jgi:hypothetical protein